VKTVSPTADDLAQVDLATRSFPNAWGCVGLDGRFTPSIMDPTWLWMMMRSNAKEMNVLWEQAGRSTGAQSSHAAMIAAKEHVVTVMFAKVRKSLFRAGWIGNVSLDFDRSNLYVGSVAGRTQADMWRQLRKFLEYDGMLYPSTAAALEAL
jgi:hypothetical protein